METNLQSLLEQAGVNAAMVIDGGGRLVGHRGRAVYDRALCEQVAGGLARAVDSMALQHEDWESLAAHFADGTILVRNLGAVAGTSFVLAVVADATLNPAFAAVSLRVAANKLKKALEGGGSRPVLAGSAPPAASGSQVVPPAPAGGIGSRPVLASTGLSWSRTFGSSAVAAADPASSAWLGKLARELARFVGPMAKLFIEEGIRRVSPDGPFSMVHSKALIEDLSAQVEDPKDRAAFVKAAEAART